MTPDQIDNMTILRTVVGSTVHGIVVEDGLEDRDEMGVAIENPNERIGFDRFEQYIYRSAEEREGRKGARSRAGDLDLVIYSLKKYLRLALRGNPSILLPLFAPWDFVVSCDTQGRELRELAPYLISGRVGTAFLGYLIAQKGRLLGLRGGRHGQRPELIERYGFDTKYASHAIRLGFQGLEIMHTGNIELPMRDTMRGYIVDVRQGEVSKEECMDTIEELEAGLKRAIETCDLPPEPDTKYVNDWMVNAYLQAWKTRNLV